MSTGIDPAQRQKITPFLWFDDQAEAAAKHYVSIFGNSRITGITRYGEARPGPAGSVMTVAFELEGQRFTALNGGPGLPFTQAVSFVVHCATQAELDRFWERLGEGGEHRQCGWLTDRFGLSWQIVPRALPELLGDPDPERSQRVMAAMLRMAKIDIAALQQAHAGP